MAKDPQYLDRLSAITRKAVVKLGGDPDFLDLVLAWYGLLRHQPQPSRTWPYWSTATQLKRKRALKAQFGDTWKVEWKKVQEAAKFYKETSLETSLFGIAPRQKRSGHRPITSNFWFAMSDTYNYFRLVSGKPNWKIVAAIFFPHSDRLSGFERAQSEYAKRKSYLKRFDAGVRLEKVMRYYDTFKPLIIPVIESGIPIWATPHRQKAQEILNETDAEVLNVVPGDDRARRQHVAVTRRETRRVLR